MTSRPPARAGASPPPAHPRSASEAAVEPSAVESAGEAAGRHDDAGQRPDDAVAFVLRSTQQRPLTEAEVAAKLRLRNVGDEVVEVALRRLRELRAVDDAAFARAWVHDRGTVRGYGTARLREELRRRLVPADIAEAALATLDDRDDRAAAVALARRRARSLPAALEPPVVARRLHGFLARRGYGDGLARGVALEVSGADRYRDWD